MAPGSSYTWNVGNYATIVSGQGTSSIIVTLFKYPKTHFYMSLFQL
ncbi:hypothetical protein [Pedobacter lusitanus]